MANVYQQQQLARKVIYFVLILVIFSVSLIHRRSVVEPQALDLQLRETARGEVELTGSAVRLLLAGPRGLVVTILWSEALKAQEKHQWSELKMVVDSITTLQPYFISPWLFQSWNLSFNVAVEHDRPRDKYFYVSEGLRLLAEGERRNQGSGEDTKPGKVSFPANPELRHQMGFYYQLKIGNSDEKNTMRCLLDLSTIDPLQRNADKFWASDQIDNKKFDEFCLDHPRLIRRLREQLHYDTRAKIVRFLKDNKDVPSRFERSNNPTATESELSEPRRQFPILPPPVDPKYYPDAKKSDLGLNQMGDDREGETLDVFLVGRSWYLYAQRPLPPPNPDHGTREATFDPLKHRMPKQLAIQIFRSYPARAQAFIAENLEYEGWFDEQGWIIPAWSRSQGGKESEPPIVAREPKYLAQNAWRAAFAMYEDFGFKNGLLLTSSEIDMLEAKAQLFRTKYKVLPDYPFALRSDEKQGEMGKSYEAHMKLQKNKQNRSLTNFDAHFNQAEAEKDPATVYARRIFYQAERARRFQSAPDLALVLYEQVWPTWMYICLKYPKFTRVQVLQEDVYEMEMWYLRLAQKQRESLFRNVFLGVAQMNAWPHPRWEDLIDPTESVKIVPFRKVFGPLDGIQYYDGPQAEEIRSIVYYLLQGATAYQGTTFVPPFPNPIQQRFMFVRTTFRDLQPVPANWRQIVEDDSITSVRARLGITR